MSQKINVTFKDLDNHNLDLFYECIDSCPVMDYESRNHADWVGCQLYEIWTKKGLAGFIGYCRYNNNGLNDYCLACIYILEEYRRKGIAKTSIRHLENILRVKQCHTMFGFCHLDNKNAIDMYIKLGFKFLNPERNAFSISEPTRDNTCQWFPDWAEFGKGVKQ